MKGSEGSPNRLRSQQVARHRRVLRAMGCRETEYRSGESLKDTPGVCLPGAEWGASMPPSSGLRAGGRVS